MRNTEAEVGAGHCSPEQSVKTFCSVTYGQGAVLGSDGANPQTLHFYVGFDYPRKPGNMARIFLNGEYFANVFQFLVDGQPNRNQPWHFNRDALALKMDCPPISPHADIRGLLERLEQWYHSAVGSPPLAARGQNSVGQSL